MRIGRTFIAAAAGALLAGASEAPGLAPGLWETVNRPGTATLDGRALNDLPLFEIQTERVCLSPEAAAEPAAFLAGDVAGECSLGKAVVADGRLEVTGVCPSEEGFEPGTLRMTGAVGRESYEISFETTTEKDNGRLGFTGTLSGRRVGECPEG